MDKEKIKKFLLDNIISVISIGIAILSIVSSGVYVYINTCPVCDECEPTECEMSIIEKEEVKEEIEIIKKIKVDVKGAVKAPGVYEMDDNSTVDDAIKKAGGLKSGAVTDNINLSKRLTDQMVIYVFTKTELEKEEVKNEIICEVPKCECETIIIGNQTGATEDDTQISDAPSNNDDVQANPSVKVSINTATIEELMTLEGIGEAKALSIIEYRNVNGAFQKLEDLMNVSGIGEKAYEKIKDRIKL